MTDRPLDVLPEVTWSEVRDHLVTRLMMDEEWIVDGDQQLTWWPTPLPMTISVVESGTFPGSTENWLQVVGTTVIAVVDEEVGRELAYEHAADYPLGGLVFEDGQLRLTTTYCINPRNRTLLVWFHEALLLQATVAVDLASQWSSRDDIELVEAAHPTSGERDDIDELTHVYLDDELNESLVDHRAMERLAAVRGFIGAAFIDAGYIPGFSNDEVDFFNLGFGVDGDGTDALQQGAFDFGLGVMPGSDVDRKLGPSLRIVARILPPGHAFDAEQVTHANAALSTLEGASVFGLISGPEQTAGGSCLWATVPHTTLREWSEMGAEVLRNSVVNAVWHVTAAAQRFRREILGIYWPPPAHEEGERQPE